MDNHFPTGNSRIKIPHFCSRNSGLIFDEIIGYRVYLGYCDKLPDIHFFIHWKSAQLFAQQQNQKIGHTEICPRPSNRKKYNFLSCVSA